MAWRMARLDWHKHGGCWTWWRVKTYRFFSGNQLVILWGSIATVFERKNAAKQ